MKPRYRYNNNTGKLDEVFRIDSGLTVIHGGRNPLTGLPYRSSFNTGYFGESHYMDARQANRIFNQSVSTIVQRANETN